MKLKRWMKAAEKVNENRNLKWKFKGTFLREQILDRSVKRTLPSRCCLTTAYLLISSINGYWLTFYLMASVLFMIVLLMTADKMKRSNYRGINHMNESAKRLWGKKTAELRAKTFQFASHEAAESHLYQLALYSFFPSPQSRKQSSISTGNEYFSLWRFMSQTENKLRKSKKR